MCLIWPFLPPSWHGPAASAAGAPCEMTPETSAAAMQAATRTAPTAVLLAFFIVPPSWMTGGRRHYAAGSRRGATGLGRSGDEVVPATWPPAFTRGDPLSSDWTRRL